MVKYVSYAARLAENKPVESRDISTLLLTLANLNYTPPERMLFLKVSFINLYNGIIDIINTLIGVAPSVCLVHTIWNGKEERTIKSLEDNCLVYRNFLFVLY